MQSLQNKYTLSHSSHPGEALDWIEKQTNIRTNYPQMLCGRVEGELLKLLVEISGAKRILEIGTFTGYSTVCMALGLPEGGHIDALEINDEMEKLIREGWSRAGVSDRIELHIGDARKYLSSVRAEAEEEAEAGASFEEYDMVFIDANKREYCEYYELVLPLLKKGGLIVVDDVMMGGKVCSEPPATDPQTVGLMKFNDLVSSDSGVESVMLPIRDGITIIRKL